MVISRADIRVLRAVVFTALCVALSAGAHVLLSGVPLPLIPLALLSGVVCALAFAVAGRERGFWHIAALLIPLELAVDTVFTTGQHACYGQGGGPVTGLARLLGVDLLCAGGSWGAPLARVVSGPDTTPVPTAVSPTASPWLLLAVHVTVGLLAAAWLRRGEAALVQVLRAAVAVSFRPLLPRTAFQRSPGVPPSVRFRPAADTALASLRPLLSHSVARRGPPCQA